MNFEVALIELHPWIPWELVADPKGSAQHTLGTTALSHDQVLANTCISKYSTFMYHLIRRLEVSYCSVPFTTVMVFI
jgi:hypothetical protein